MAAMMTDQDPPSQENPGRGQTGLEDGHSGNVRLHRTRDHSESDPRGIHARNPSAYLHRRKSSGRISTRRRVPASASQQDDSQKGRKWWRFHLREWDDNDESDWWFAGTAIPLLAATIGPLANVLSIAALVTPWRMCLVANVPASDAAECLWSGDNDALGPELQGQTFTDPRWAYWLNVISLIVGFIGNFFLLCNFTNRIKYIIALPVTIACWYVATGILTAITISMDIYVPPIRPQQTYTQGFWYAVIAACMYLLLSMLLMINMLGYFLGHYPRQFTLTESQRTLILQTMLFFIWLAGGGAIFSAVEGRYGLQGDDGFPWTFVNALYFCDVTILTVGFGDLYPTSDIGRGLVFPYSVLGIIILGLMVSSITKFARELGSQKVVKRHVERKRVRTMDRTVTNSTELERKKMLLDCERPPTSSAAAFAESTPDKPRRTGTASTVKRVGSILTPTRKPKLLLLREEKDRFDAMRRIQLSTSRLKNWYALFLSILAFALLWNVGAVVFWQAEKGTQGMTYFQALYFCYISLLTIGYGDLSPQSNAGRPFFVFWSLIAVPTMTILVSDLGETVINKFKRGTSGLADYTVLPQRGMRRLFIDRNPWLLAWLQRRKQRKEVQEREEEGLPYGPEPEFPPTIDDLAREDVDTRELGKNLAKAIRRVASDIRGSKKKRYSYEEWVEFTQLIRFTAAGQTEGEEEEEEEKDLVEWDWIGENSPMMADKSEAEFVLDRLCESLERYVRG